MKLFHATTTDNLDVILDEGIIPGCGPDHFGTFDPCWIWPDALEHMYPVKPVYLSVHEPIAWLAEWHHDQGREAVLLGVDASGMTLLPDLPSLNDQDVELSEGGLILPSTWRDSEQLHWFTAHESLLVNGRMIGWQHIDEVAETIIAITETVAVCEIIRRGRIEVLDWRSLWPHHWQHLANQAA